MIVQMNSGPVWSSGLTMRMNRGWPGPDYITDMVNHVMPEGKDTQKGKKTPPYPNLWMSRQDCFPHNGEGNQGFILLRDYCIGPEKNFHNLR